VNRPRPVPAPLRGFSLVELLIALTISATLLVATLSALDACFKSYKTTSESASAHVVARMVMHRVSALIRNGEEFGPYPVNPILTPVLVPDPPSLEFVSARDEAGLPTEVTRLERRDAPSWVIAEGGPPFELWNIRTRFSGGLPVGDPEEAPLLRNVQHVQFTLYYDVGPRLTRATVDLTLRPDDLRDAAIAAGLETLSIRLVTSVSPRRVD